MLEQAPDLTMWHLKAALLERRGADLADRVFGHSGALASMAAVPGPASRTPHAGFARALCTGALWTKQRMQDVGYLVDASCPRCGGDTDSVYHRLWRCAATAGARAEIPRAAGEDAAEEKLRALIAAGGQ